MLGTQSSRKREEFDGLILEHHVQLRGFVRSLGVDPDWVDDVAQEAFLIAYKEWASFDRSRDFGKWLRGIAANIVRNELRKDARRQRILHTSLVDLLLQRHAERNDPAEPLALEAIRDCLAKLPPRSRELVQARYGDGHNAPELARKFEISPDNARQMLVRIRMRIKQCVEFRTMGVTTDE